MLQLLPLMGGLASMLSRVPAWVYYAAHFPFSGVAAMLTAAIAMGRSRDVAEAAGVPVGQVWLAAGLYWFLAATCLLWALSLRKVYGWRGPPRRVVS